MRRRRQTSEHTNPFIPFTDLLVNIVLVLGFLLTTINAGWETSRYTEFQQTVKDAVYASIPPSEWPECYPANKKNDPPGSQRWVFNNSQLFDRNLKLTRQGKLVLQRFGDALKEIPSRPGEKQRYLWRRIRIEGHLHPSRRRREADIYRSVAMASDVYNYLWKVCWIPPNFMAASGRGAEDYETRSEDRVEIIVEFQGR